MDKNVHFYVFLLLLDREIVGLKCEIGEWQQCLKGLMNVVN